MFKLPRQTHWKRREKNRRVLVAALDWEYRALLGAIGEVWIEMLKSKI